MSEETTVLKVQEDLDPKTKLEYYETENRRILARIHEETRRRAEAETQLVSLRDKLTRVDALLEEKVNRAVALQVQVEGLEDKLHVTERALEHFKALAAKSGDKYVSLREVYKTSLSLIDSVFRAETKKGIPITFVKLKDGTIGRGYDMISALAHAESKVNAQGREKAP